jgi:hypothetical protein
MLTTIQECIDALGGRARVRELTGATTHDVSNWLRAGRFPARLHHFLAVEWLLLKHGLPVDPKVFGQYLGPDDEGT